MPVMVPMPATPLSPLLDDIGPPLYAAELRRFGSFFPYCCASCWCFFMEESGDAGGGDGRMVKGRGYICLRSQ